MQVKLLLVTFYLNGGLHAVSVAENWTDVKFLDGSVLKTKSEPTFGFLHIAAAFPHKIWLKLDNQLLSYGQKKQIFNMVAVCHLEL